MPRPNLTLNAEKKIPDVHSPELSDEEASHNVTEITSQDKFTDELKIAFQQKIYPDSDLNKINVRSLDDDGKGKGINSSNHFIFLHEDHKKEYHVKAALHGSGISLGTKFNESFKYKLNDLLSVGPKSDGIVTQDGVLMIITEDLKGRKGEGKDNKSVKFEDSENPNEPGKKKEILDNNPERLKENIHRCATEMVINLNFYTDISNNPANVGFKNTTKVNLDGLSVEKNKPFIIDFRLSNEDDLARKFLESDDYREVSKREETTKYAAEIGLRLSEKQETLIRKDIFSFDENPEVFKKALKKLFLDDEGNPTKYNKAIEEAFTYTKELIPNIESENGKQHLEALTRQKGHTLSYAEKFLENDKIKEFFAQEKEKFDEGKPSGSMKPESEATLLSGNLDELGKSR